MPPDSRIIVVLPDNVALPEKYNWHYDCHTQGCSETNKSNSKGGKKRANKMDISEWLERPWHKDRTQLWNTKDQCAAPEKAWHCECSDVDDRTIFVLKSHTKTGFF